MTSRTRVTAVAVGLWLALAAAASLALWHLREDALDSQARELGLLSLAITDDIERGLRGVEEGLHALRAQWRDGILPDAGSDARRALRIRADLMPLVRTLWRVDAAGRVSSGSDDTPLPDLATFAPALAAPAAGDEDPVAVSRPFADAPGRETLVALAVRAGEARSGGGWIIAAVPAGALLGAFSPAVPAADARLSVFRRDGVRLAGTAQDPPVLDEASVARHLAAGPTLEVRRFADGSEHLIGVHGVVRYGVKVIVSRDLAPGLAAWRGAVALVAGALALFAALLAVCGGAVLRADRRRLQAQRALQEQQARAGRLESLGTLAGGVAHDFNNVLAGIVGFGEMAQDAAAPGSAQARHLERLLQAAMRGQALIERILAFSRGGARAAIVFELQPVVDEVLTLFSAAMRPGVVVGRSLQAPGARLRGDPLRAFEALMNLCTNAQQAMPQGGLLRVSLERQAVRAERVMSHSRLPPGRYLVLAVADQGGGIAPSVMEHLFEPFFTTRGAQAGTGLGLAMVHGVVAEFGGAVDVQSPPGQGARFTLYLPECEDEPVEAAAPARAATSRPGPSLLVVDDEPELVALALEMLRGLGYDAVGCIDGAAALELLREQPQRFAALVTDESMPRLGGTQLAQTVRGRGLTLPVLLVSGYGGAALAQRAAEAGVTRVLGKPLRRADLACVLEDVLR